MSHSHHPPASGDSWARHHRPQDALLKHSLLLGFHPQPASRIWIALRPQIHNLCFALRNPSRTGALTLGLSIFASGLACATTRPWLPPSTTGLRVGIVFHFARFTQFGRSSHMIAGSARVSFSPLSLRSFPIT